MFYDPSPSQTEMTLCKQTEREVITNSNVAIQSADDADEI